MHPSSRWVRWIRAGGAILLALIAYILFVNDRGPPPNFSVPGSNERSIADPRLHYTGPYLNVHPTVKYVGDAACADCHQKETETFRQHPMGRSLFHVSEEPTPVPSAPTESAPVQAHDASLWIERHNARVLLHEFRVDQSGRKVYDHEIELKYVVGSGTRGQSFFWERDGFVQQAPISWYAEKRVWELAPGFAGVEIRPIESRCLFCHANRVEPVASSLHRFAEPVFRGTTIGCERCHGPGEKHVARWSGQEPAPAGQDFAIVNPRRLSWKAREAVCQQCHLEGETRLVKRGRGLNDFRPGLALEDFWAIAVHDEEDWKAVNHVEQMYRSRCFQNSPDDRKLGCISCHDPHVKPTTAERVDHYRSACLKCHIDDGKNRSFEKPCSVPISERTQKIRNSCIDCHMPKRSVTDIAHVAGSDHRILRRPEPDAGHPHAVGVHAGKNPLRLFHRQPQEATAEDRRDLGVALAEVINQDRLPTQYAPMAIDLLDAALEQMPLDSEAWEAKGIALVRANRLRDGAAAFAKALEFAPQRESALTNAAYLAQRMDRKTEAIDYWKQAVRLNPHRPVYHANLAALLSNERRWQEGKEHADRCVELEPGNIEARRARTLYLLRLNDRDAARREFAVIEALRPANLADLKAWWEMENR